MNLNKTYFVHIRNPRTGEYYSAYNDYFRLVHISGFQECDLEEVKPHSNNTYIFTLNYHGLNQGPIPDEYFPKTRTARYILHQIERYNIIDDRYDEIWLSDRSMPELNHPKTKYVVLGGDRNFMQPLQHLDKEYDFYHMCYTVGRRGPMITDLARSGFSIADAPEDWTYKNRYMQQSRVGLALHQHPDSVEIIEPLRYTVYSCMKLPILAERSTDAFPYFTYSYEDFLKNPVLTTIINWQDNYELLTGKYTFKYCMVEALR
jgi:hypothetical protein